MEIKQGLMIQHSFDTDLEKVWEENAQSIYSNTGLKKIVSLNLNGDKLDKLSKPELEKHGIFFYLSKKTFKSVVIKDVNNRKDNRGHLTANRLIESLPIHYKQFFVRNYTNKYVSIMDTFDYDLLYIISNETWSIAEMEKVCAFVIEGIFILLYYGYCYTDIKIEQVFVRKRKNASGYYHSIGGYEFAIGDLDFVSCSGSEGHMHTVKPPSYVRTAQEITLFALGITCAEIMGADVSYFMKQGSKKKSVVDHQIRIILNRVRGIDNILYNFIERSLRKDYHDLVDLFGDFY